MDTDTRTIISCLEKKLKAFEDFLTATLTLKEDIQQGRTETMAGLLRRRGGLIARIDELDLRIARLRTGALSRTPEAARTIEEITKRIIDVIKRVDIVNEECEAVVSQRRRELGGEIGALNQEAQGLRGYSQREQGTAKFLNIQM